MRRGVTRKSNFVDLVLALGLIAVMTLLPSRTTGWHWLGLAVIVYLASVVVNRPRGGSRDG